MNINNYPCRQELNQKFGYTSDLKSALHTHTQNKSLHKESYFYFFIYKNKWPNKIKDSFLRHLTYARDDDLRYQETRFMNDKSLTISRHTLMVHVTTPTQPKQNYTQLVVVKPILAIWWTNSVFFVTIFICRLFWRCAIFSFVSGIFLG